MFLLTLILGTLRKSRSSNTGQPTFYNLVVLGVFKAFFYIIFEISKFKFKTQERSPENMTLI